jgi:hypothetical protein
MGCYWARWLKILSFDNFLDGLLFDRPYITRSCWRLFRKINSDIQMECDTVAVCQYVLLVMTAEILIVEKIETTLTVKLMRR